MSDQYCAKEILRLSEKLGAADIANGKLYMQLDAERTKVQSLERSLAQARAEGRWVPVGERLPRNEECVLIVYDGKVEIGYYSQHGGYWTDWADTGTDYPADVVPVTHWQPLPLAPTLLAPAERDKPC